MSVPLVLLMVGSTRIRQTALGVLAERWRPRIVFVGDSLTSGGGTWGPRLGMHPFAARNIGRGSFRSVQIQAHMRQAIALRPPWIALCAGANDLTDRHFSADETLNDVRQMIVMAQAERIRVVLTLVPHRSQPIAGTDELNASLRTLPADAIVDLNPQIAPDGRLLEQYTTDGVHLSEAAYRVWGAELRKALVWDVATDRGRHRIRRAE